MAHDAHHDTHHHSNVEATPTTSFRSAFWFVLILAGLFVAAVNFVDVMGHDEEGHGGGHATEHATGTGHEAGHGAEHATPGAHSNEQNATDVQKHEDGTAPASHTGKEASKDEAHH